jgi:hypothetical protein
VGFPSIARETPGETLHLAYMAEWSKAPDS